MALIQATNTMPTVTISKEAADATNQEAFSVSADTTATEEPHGHSHAEGEAHSH
ncbi:hypothetical protein [Flavobacterium sp.]|uniref:hypothetical protein n=1 Tax=Flavobacterium sp. TaxID=239 RepID=UPI0039E233D6